MLIASNRIGRVVCGALLALNVAFSQAFAIERPEWTSWSASPHFSSRSNEEISAIIVHYTAGGSLGSTVSWFRNPDAKTSSHYVVERDGSIVQMVELDQAAWHAGKSEIDGKANVNKYSVGIEVCNWGKLRKEGDRFLTYTGNKYEGLPPFQDDQGNYWEPFTEEQYQAIAQICNHCLGNFKITHITGHSDISIPVGRKVDPGNAFKWDSLRTKLNSGYQGQFGSIDRK